METIKHILLNRKIRKLEFGILQRGYTLIELLVVIALIGILAGLLLVTVKPQEQIARAYDSKRKTDLNLIAKALIVYRTENNGQYPAASSAWMDEIVGGAILRSVPEKISGIECTTNNPSIPPARSYCYAVNGANVIAYSRLQAKSSRINNNCAGPVAFLVWRSQTESMGIECPASGEPSV